MQLVGDTIFVFKTVAQKMFNIKFRENKNTKRKNAKETSAKTGVEFSNYQQILNTTKFSEQQTTMSPLLL